MEAYSVGRTGQWAAMYYADSIKVKAASNGASTGNPFQ